ncbi:hypothetical protein [Corynebacterium pseudogenitalium]|uniref:Apea-like HEPN domain-containing protein n=1 Tax=Corynebacterium pseudogenitalium TaxID=38303 RepID=A0ABD4TRX7_9CORY|nr:hypothetical protein [Corynebacterium pseudogenitalium]MCQ4615064.1 hypothetical protein [Corynebacterium pseudogenitalium]
MIKIKPEKLEGLVPRMLELTSRSTPWHRSDWRAGTLELVEETLSESRIPGTYEKALSELRDHMANALRKDPGVSGKYKEGLIRCAKNISPSSDVDSYHVSLADKYVQELRQTYLENWAAIFDAPERAGDLDIEGTAKRIVSHLLYCGVPASSVYKVVHERKNDIEEHEFSSVLRDLDKKSKTQVKNFSFAVPVGRAPDFLYPSPPSGWLTAQQLKQWKHRNAPNAEMIRHQGGFILTVEARDVNEAAREAQGVLSQLSFKFQSGSDNEFDILPKMWSQEKGNVFETRRRNHSLRLRAFKRADALHQLEITPKVRNILAIIEPLQTHDPHVAVVNGWAAIESLLVDSHEDDRVGAERMAGIIAASYFRTELTWLARNYAEHYKDTCLLAKRISESALSIDRAKLMSEAITKQDSFDRLNQTDRLAIDKMREAIDHPNAVFDRTRNILTREFQRMYRKRNLIVHSGRAVENGIESVTDKVIPLLVNGIDQLLIANIQHGLDPKKLAALVDFKSQHLGERSKSDSLLDLLEFE